MKRKATMIARSADGRYEIYVDTINAEEIIAYLESDERHRKKFRFIKGVVLNGQPHDSFKREDIDGKSRDVYAMRFFVGQENDRLYCKKISKADRIVLVIMCELHLSKKATELSHKEITIIQKVASYEYDI